jgi:hypothetical protein
MSEPVRRSLQGGMMFLSMLIAAPSGVVSGASARSRTVIDTFVVEGYGNPTAEFAINEKEGRAWVEAAVDRGGGVNGDDYDRQAERSRVEGLSYDAQAREIVYLDEGLRIVCARVTTSKFLFTTLTHINVTEPCELTARLVQKNYDDGFEHKTRKHLVVQLTITR